MNLKKILWITLGCVGIGLGALGVVLPMLPAFPFLLLAAFSFAKSSEKLHTWFTNSKLYKKNLESYIKGKGMTWVAKIRIMISVTVMMSVALASCCGRAFTFLVSSWAVYGCFTFFTLFLE